MDQIILEAQIEALLIEMKENDDEYNKFLFTKLKAELDYNKKIQDMLK